MRALIKVRIHIAFIVVVATLFVCTTARGMNLYIYNLDSLVYMGPQIVEGTLGDTHVISNFTAWNFKISAVYGGGLKVGQSIDVTALDFFRVSRNSPFGGDSLKKGDQLFLFLARATGDHFLYNIPQNAEIYWPAPSGVRVVDGGKVFGFSQFINPGPYTAILDGAELNPKPPTTVSQFRDQIRESIPRVEGWRPLLDREAQTNDVPALLEILRQRATQTNGTGGDFIAQKVCRHLTDLHDNDAMFDAAKIGLDQWLLSGGFATPAGREFLLKIIGDDHKSMKDRILSAKLLAQAGEGTPQEWHLKRIAEFAALPKQNLALQVALLDSMHQITRGFQPPRGSVTEPTTMEDRKEAGTILTQLATVTSSEEAKYEVDLVLPSLGFSPLSSRNCLLQLDHYDPATRKLTMRCHISGVAGMNPIPIAFVNMKSGQKWIAQSTLYFHGDETESPSGVVVPKDVPPGHYKVFYEFTEKGKVTGTSHYFEFDL